VKIEERKTPPAQVKVEERKGSATQNLKQEERKTPPGRPETRPIIPSKPEDRKISTVAPLKVEDKQNTMKTEEKKEDKKLEEPKKAPPQRPEEKPANPINSIKDRKASSPVGIKIEDKKAPNMIKNDNKEKSSPRLDSDIKIITKMVPRQPPRPQFLDTPGENRLKSSNVNVPSNGSMVKQNVRQKGQNSPVNHSVGDKTKWRRSKSDGDFYKNFKGGLSALTISEELRQELLPWLESYGLDQYIDLMCHEKIDFEIIPSMGEKDLRDIGITIQGDIKKFLEAIEDLKTVK